MSLPPLELSPLGNSTEGVLSINRLRPKLVNIAPTISTVTAMAIKSRFFGSMHTPHSQTEKAYTPEKGSGGWDEALERYGRVLPLLREAGVTLALETEPAVMTTNAGLLRRFLDGLDAPEIMALWDPGNLPFDPEGERPYPEGYGLLRGRIAHVHLKDAVGKGADARAVCLGEGLVDFPGQLAALERDGYRGYLSLETHYRLGEALTEEEMRLPGGYQFSKGGRAASQECMDALKKWR